MISRPLCQQRALSQSFLELLVLHHICSPPIPAVQREEKKQNKQLWHRMTGNLPKRMLKTKVKLHLHIPNDTHVRFKRSSPLVFLKTTQVR